MIHLNLYPLHFIYNSTFEMQSNVSFFHYMYEKVEHKNNHNNRKNIKFREIHFLWNKTRPTPFISTANHFGGYMECVQNSVDDDYDDNNGRKSGNSGKLSGGI